MKHEILTKIRELFFYGDITKEDFLKYSGMARSKDIEMFRLAVIVINNLYNSFPSKDWKYPNKRFFLAPVRGGTLFYNDQLKFYKINEYGV